MLSLNQWYTALVPTAHINDIDLYYELRKEKDSRGTVAFFNGVMASSSSWEYYADFFNSAGYTVFLHDFRGQLLSEKPTGVYTFSQHAADAVALFEHLGIKRPHIIGTSYGGETAMRLAVDFPDVPLTISIIDSVSETDEVLDCFVDLWIQLAETGDPARFFWGMLPTVYSSKFIRENRTALEKRALKLKEVPPDYFSGQISLYRTFKEDVRMTDELGSIICPALVACGELDILKPLPFSQKIADAVPDCDFVIIPDAGHAAFIEQPRLLANLLLGFIRGHELQSPA